MGFTNKGKWKREQQRRLFSYILNLRLYRVEFTAKRAHQPIASQQCVSACKSGDYNLLKLRASFRLGEERGLKSLVAFYNIFTASQACSGFTENKSREQQLISRVGSQYGQSGWRHRRTKKKSGCASFCGLF